MEIWHRIINIEFDSKFQMSGANSIATSSAEDAPVHFLTACCMAGGKSFNSAFCFKAGYSCSCQSFQHYCEETVNSRQWMWKSMGAFALDCFQKGELQKGEEGLWDCAAGSKAVTWFAVVWSHSWEQCSHFIAKGKSSVMHSLVSLTRRGFRAVESLACFPQPEKCLLLPIVWFPIESLPCWIHTVKELMLLIIFSSSPLKS